MILAAAVIAASLVGWTGHAMLSTSPAPDVIRLTIPVLEGITTAETEKSDVAISRDGRTVLFPVPEARGTLVDFDVTADGQRFLIRLPNTEAYARGIDLVMNSFNALRKRQADAAR